MNKTFQRKIRFGLTAVVSTIAMLASTGCGELTPTGAPEASSTDVAKESAPIEGRPDITQFCGTKPMTVALVEGMNGNAWHTIGRAQFETEAAKCPNITKTFYTSANGDPQKYASDISGLVAQGVNAIITFDDFGVAALPAIKKATKAGVAVVPFVADPQGVPGTDYVTFIAQDEGNVGAAWADWASKVLNGKGKVAMLGATPGNPLSAAFLSGFKKAAPEGLELVQDEPLTTSWTIAGVQQATAGLLAKYPDIDLILSDFGQSIGAIERAFSAAGKPLVPIAATASSNDTACQWQTLKAKNPNYELLSVDGTTNVVPIALRKAVASVQGIKNDEPSVLELPVVIDTLNGKMPKCDPSLPADAVLAADLTPEQIAKAFAQ